MQSKQVQKRSPIAVLLLPIITFGIYNWYWQVKTKGELNRSGCSNIPTAWIWLIPFVGTIYWLWKYSVAVDEYTNRRCSAGVAFLLMFLLGSIGSAIVQNYFNEELNDQPVNNNFQQPGQPTAPTFSN